MLPAKVEVTHFYGTVLIRIFDFYSTTICFRLALGSFVEEYNNKVQVNFSKIFSDQYEDGTVAFRLQYATSCISHVSARELDLRLIYFHTGKKTAAHWFHGF